MTILEPAFTVPTRPQPPRPDGLHGIAVVGCGLIGDLQLRSYREAGWHVSALCDVDAQAVEAARRTHYPDAVVTGDYREVLARDDVTVVDLAVHTDVRADMVREALRAGKHVLSQKPFVEDLATGHELVNLAREHDRHLAVNQTARWAPHFAFLRHLVHDGWVGAVHGADFAVFSGHDMAVREHPLGRTPHLVLYDYAIHWFDLIAQLFDNRPCTRIWATTSSRPGQVVDVATVASVVLEFVDGQATLCFRASNHFEDENTFHVSGSKGSVAHVGPSLGGTELELRRDGRVDRLVTAGAWVPDGLLGAMGELLCAIEQQRRPANDAASSLAGLALCFAAITSAESGRSAVPDVDGLTLPAAARADG